MKYVLKLPLAIHEIGQRPNQEDSIFPKNGSATSESRLFILCDGMGGHEKGEVASQTVCEELSSFIQKVGNPNRPFSDSMLDSAMEAVYNVLDSRDDGNEKKMGTTLAMIYFQPGGAMAAHIGDSRYYHIRPKTREIVYRSKDHSLLNELYEAGEITKEEIPTTRGKNVIMRAIMPNQPRRDMPDIVHIKDIQPGDLFYICSDGMLEQMSDEELLNILCNQSLTSEQKRDCLIAATMENRDNHSAYLIEVESAQSDAIDANEPDDEAEARSANKMLNDKDETVNITCEGLPEVVIETPKEQNKNPSNAPKKQTQTHKPDYQTPPKAYNSKSQWRATAAGALLALVIVGAIAFFLISNNKEKPAKTSPINIVPATELQNKSNEESVIERSEKKAETPKTYDDDIQIKIEEPKGNTSKKAATGTKTAKTKNKLEQNAAEKAAKASDNETLMKDAANKAAEENSNNGETNKGSGEDKKASSAKEKKKGKIKFEPV